MALIAVGSAVLADQAAAVAATGQAVAATEVLVVAEVADHPQPEAQVVLAAAVVVAQLAQEDVVATVAVEVVALPLGQEAPVQFFFSGVLVIDHARTSINSGPSCVCR